MGEQKLDWSENGLTMVDADEPEQIQVVSEMPLQEIKLKPKRLFKLAAKDSKPKPRKVKTESGMLVFVPQSQHSGGVAWEVAGVCIAMLVATNLVWWLMG